MCSPGEQVRGIHAVGTAMLEQQNDGDGWTCFSGGKGEDLGMKRGALFTKVQLGHLGWTTGCLRAWLRMRKEDGRSDRMVTMHYSPAEQGAKGSPALEQVVWEGCIVLTHRNLRPD